MEMKSLKMWWIIMAIALTGALGACGLTRNDTAPSATLVAPKLTSSMNALELGPGRSSSSLSASELGAGGNCSGCS